MSASACELVARVSSIDGGAAWRVRALCTCEPVPRVLADTVTSTRAGARRTIRELRRAHAWGRLE